MELGSIERELFVEASPDVVFAVVSDPEHVKRWWPDDARYDAAAGSTGELRFGDGDAVKTVAFTVVEADAPRRFSFRWTQPAGTPARAGNSLLVTFDLIPSGDGTLLKFRETGFRERGWETALIEEEYRDHVAGWDHFLPRLTSYVATLARA